MEPNTWKDLAPDRSVRCLKYSFGIGTTNCVAARLDDGSWMVISPSRGAGEADFAALGAKVSALVAPNAYHHMGQKVWRDRFPEAVSYAPDGSLERLKKQCPDVPYRSLDELTAKLPERIKLMTPVGHKKPDVIGSFSSGGAMVWYMGDMISNTQATDLKFMPRMIFTMLGGGTGYRFNRVPAMIYLSDKKAWKGAVKAAMQDRPPTAVVPAHGDVVTEDVANRSQKILG